MNRMPNRADYDAQELFPGFNSSKSLWPKSTCLCRPVHIFRAVDAASAVVIRVVRSGEPDAASRGAGLDAHPRRSTNSAVNIRAQKQLRSSLRTSSKSAMLVDVVGP